MFRFKKAHLSLLLTLIAPTYRTVGSHAAAWRAIHWQPIIDTTS